ncbi:MAG: hypothetical protein PVH47_02365 [Thiohalocapsa sp.]|jgi:hypothetical protein
MDRFTRIYATLLGAVVIAGVAFWVASAWQPRVWEINEQLASDPQLARYVYPFRVLSLDDGVATLSTPRSVELPTHRFLQIIRPELAGKTQDDPAMVTAQQELVDHQKRAMTLVEALPDVTRVDWRLDTQWLSDHGVVVPR